MPYNFVANGFTQRYLVADFLRKKCSFGPKTAIFAFLSPLWVGLKGNVCYSS